MDYLVNGEWSKTNTYTPVKYLLFHLWFAIAPWPFTIYFLPE